MKNFKSDIFKTSKTKTYPRNIQKIKLKNKSNVKRPQMNKKSENRPKVKFKYIINDFFKNVKSHKLTTKHPKPKH